MVDSIIQGDGVIETLTFEEPAAGATGAPAADAAVAAAAAADISDELAATPAGVTEDNEAAKKASVGFEAAVLKSKRYGSADDGRLDMDRMAAHAWVYGLDTDGNVATFERAYRVRYRVDNPVPYLIEEADLSAITPEKKAPKEPVDLSASRTAAQNYYDKNFDLTESGTTYGNRLAGTPAIAGPTPTPSTSTTYTMPSGLTDAQKQDALRRVAYQATADLGITDPQGAQLFARDISTRPGSPEAVLGHLNKHLASPPAGLADHYASPRAYAEFRALGPNPTEADKAHFDKVYDETYASQSEPDQWKTVYVDGATGQGQYRTALVGETPKAEDVPAMIDDDLLTGDVLDKPRKEEFQRAANATLKKQDDAIARQEKALAAVDAEIDKAGTVDQARTLGEKRKGIADALATARTVRDKHRLDLLSAYHGYGDVEALTDKGFRPIDPEKAKMKQKADEIKHAAEKAKEDVEGGHWYDGGIWKGTKEILGVPGVVTAPVNSVFGIGELLFKWQKPADVRAKQLELAQALEKRLEEKNKALADHSKTRADGFGKFIEGRLQANDQKLAAAAGKGNTPRDKINDGGGAGIDPDGPQGPAPSMLTKYDGGGETGPDGKKRSRRTQTLEDKAAQLAALRQIDRQGGGTVA